MGKGKAVAQWNMVLCIRQIWRRGALMSKLQSNLQKVKEESCVTAPSNRALVSNVRT